jgi:hypothetical protein
VAALLQVGGSQVKDCVGKVVQQHRDKTGEEQGEGDDVVCKCC